MGGGGVQAAAAYACLASPASSTDSRPSSQARPLPYVPYPMHPRILMLYM